MARAMATTRTRADPGGLLSTPRNHPDSLPPCGTQQSLVWGAQSKAAVPLQQKQQAVPARGQQPHPTQQQHRGQKACTASSKQLSRGSPSVRLPRWIVGLGFLGAHQAALLRAAPASFAAGTRSLLPLNLADTQGGGGGPQSSGGGGGGGGGAGGVQPLATVAAASEPVVLTVASFAVTKMAYVRITKMFREDYLASTGVDVRFRLTFTGSGVQARAVIDGLPADMVALALPLDVEKIVDAALIRPDWPKAYPNNSVVCETTVALVTRRGNPKGIKDWDDLTTPGLQVVLGNPKTAGVARWIFLALWGHKMKKGDAAALDYVTKVFDNVVVQPRDAREASDVFYRQRIGDVLLTYENEVVLTNQIYGPEKALPYIVPSPNVRISCPLALVDKVLDTRPAAARQAAHSFAQFCFSPRAQVEFGEVGFRPNPKLCKEQPEHLASQRPVKMWNVEDALGGWVAAQRKFFDSGKVLDRIQSEVGARRVARGKAGAIVQRHKAA